MSGEKNGVKYSVIILVNEKVAGVKCLLFFILIGFILIRGDLYCKCCTWMV